MSSFPIFIEVGQVPPLVVGGGDLAAAKARTLLKRSPRITLAADDLSPALSGLVRQGVVERLGRTPREDDIRGRPLVVSATGDLVEDTRISNLARALGVPVNVPDKPALCTFGFGAFVDRGEVVVAIGTEGAAPILATHLRAKLEQDLHPRLGRLAAIARDYREAASKCVPFGAERRAFWAEVLTGPTATAILEGDEPKGRRMITELLTGRPVQANAVGRIILVGAGPGDPELLTLKAVRTLKSADVVVYDTGVGDGVLDCARREAHLVRLGAPLDGHPDAAAGIDAMMVAMARDGKIVVRLKAGDAQASTTDGETAGSLRARGAIVEIIAGVVAVQQPTHIHPVSLDAPQAPQGAAS